jgi:hypothetical protein
VGQPEHRGLETRQYHATMEEFLWLTLVFSRMQEIIILADIWWQDAVQVVLKEEVLLIVCATRFRLRKRSEVMARR